MTNKDQYIAWLRKFEERKKILIDNVMREAPSCTYEVDQSGGISKLILKSFDFRSGFQVRDVTSLKRVSKNDLQKLIKYVQDQTKFKKENVQLWYADTSNMVYTLYILGSSLFLSWPEAEQKSLEIRERIAKEDELIAKGFVRCYYCRAVCPPEQMSTNTLISTRMYGPNGKQVQVCSGKCGAHAQFSLED